MLRRQPTIILFHDWRLTERPISRDEVSPATTSEREIWARDSFHADYQLRSVQLGSVYFNFFERVQH